MPKTPLIAITADVNNHLKKSTTTLYRFYREDEGRCVDSRIGEAALPPCLEMLNKYAPPPFNFAFLREKYEGMESGGAGAEDAPAGAPERITTESNRTIWCRATTRAERARLIQSLEMGSRIV